MHHYIIIIFTKQKARTWYKSGPGDGESISFQAGVSNELDIILKCPMKQLSRSSLLECWHIQPTNYSVTILQYIFSLERMTSY
jgi:hypothetical protein